MNLAPEIGKHPSEEAVRSSELRWRVGRWRCELRVSVDGVGDRLRSAGRHLAEDLPFVVGEPTRTICAQRRGRRGILVNVGIATGRYFLDKRESLDPVIGPRNRSALRISRQMIFLLVVDTGLRYPLVDAVPP